MSDPDALCQVPAAAAALDPGAARVRTSATEARERAAHGAGDARADAREASHDAIMDALYAQLDAEARAVLDDEEYAAWLRLRQPTPRREL